MLRIFAKFSLCIFAISALATAGSAQTVQQAQNVYENCLLKHVTSLEPRGESPEAVFNAAKLKCAKERSSVQSTLSRDLQFLEMPKRKADRRAAAALVEKDNKRLADIVTLIKQIRANRITERNVQNQ